MEILGIIPARGGSKGVPRKNVRKLGGRPLVGIAAQEACRARQLNRVIVNTEDPEIARIGAQFGAEVPFLRPADLAGDTSNLHDAIRNCLIRLEESEKYRPDLLILLQPVCPFRTGEHIDEGISLLLEVLRDKVADGVVSLTDPEYSPYLMKKLDSQGLLEAVVETKRKVFNRQELDKTYRPSGMFYALPVSLFLETMTFYPPKTKGIIWPREDSINIDTPLDWALAETVLKNRNEIRTDSLGK